MSKFNDEALRLHKRFVYKRDKKGAGDRYRILPDTPDFPQEGDCEDWSLTVLWRTLGGLWGFIWNVLVLHRSRLWFVRTADGGGHAVAEHRGEWADNWTGRALSEGAFFQETGHVKKYVIPGPLIVFYLLVDKIGFLPASLLVMCLVSLGLTELVFFLFL